MMNKNSFFTWRSRTLGHIMERVSYVAARDKAIRAMLPLGCRLLPVQAWLAVQTVDNVKMCFKFSSFFYFSGFSETLAKI